MKEFGMKRVVVLGSALLVLCGLSGCGGNNYDAVMSDLIKALDNTAGILEEVTQENLKKEETRQKLEEAAKEFKELKRRADALNEQLSKEDRERLEKKYREKLTEALTRVDEAWKKVAKLKGAEEALAGPLQEFDEISKQR